MQDIVLGYYIYPLPKGIVYTKEQLMQEGSVEELFGYCGILEGIIKPEGWVFLVEYYGYEKLYEISQRSLWPDSDCFEEFQQEIQWRCR